MQSATQPPEQGTPAGNQTVVRTKKTLAETKVFKSLLTGKYFIGTKVQDRQTSPNRVAGTSLTFGTEDCLG